MKMLGTHNTMTYLTPHKWWMKLINFTAKCQDISISEQFELGVRFFDMRVRLVGDKVTIAHGIIEYDFDPICMVAALTALAYLNPKEQIYCRVMSEDNFMTKKQRKKQDAAFIAFCNKLAMTYTPSNLHFVGGCRKTDWECIFKFKDKQPSMEGCHASVGKNLIGYIWPWFYSKLHNKAAHKRGTDKDVFMLDFIELGMTKNK